MAVTGRKEKLTRLCEQVAVCVRDVTDRHTDRHTDRQTQTYRYIQTDRQLPPDVVWIAIIS